MNQTRVFPTEKSKKIDVCLSTDRNLLLRAPVRKKKANCKFRDKGGKFDFFHFLADSFGCN